MKIAISYFYQIRNFKENMLPLSTACWDPKWFHDNQDEKHIFIDKRGIINGIRILPLHPDVTCEGLCQGKQCTNKKPSQCAFLQTYEKQLNNLNFEELYTDMENLANKFQEYKKLKEEPILVLIVYETPTNPCSERQILIKYFNLKGINCQELQYPI